MQLQCGYSATHALLTTRKVPLQCQAMQQDQAMPLTVRDVVE
jgi:hypothetical protein